MYTIFITAWISLLYEIFGILFIYIRLLMDDITVSCHLNVGLIHFCIRK
ncbi:MAG: hypothetical protein ACEY29_02615 [Arsenophonus sp.]